MRIYVARITFENGQPALARIVQATQEWLANGDRFGPSIGQFDFEEQCCSESEDSSFAVDSVHTNDSVLWACRYSHPDKQVEGRRWTAEIGASLEPARGFVSVTLDLETTDHRVGMQRFTPTRPQIVVRLIAALREQIDRDFTDIAEPLDSEGAQSLVERIHDESRRLPIVIVSLDQRSDRPLVDVSRMASLLAGIARVYVYSDKLAGLRFSETIGKQWSVWDGAVRIYWPMRAANKTPFEHRRWMKWHLTRLREIGSSENAIFQYICRNACLLSSQLVVTVEDVVRTRSQQRLDELSKTAEDVASLGELVQMYEVLHDETQVERHKKEKELAALRHENEDLARKLLERADENDALKQNLKQLYEHERKPIPDVARPSIEDALILCASVHELVQWYQSEYEDRLFFTGAAEKDAKASTFQDLRPCAEALRILGTAFWGNKHSRSVGIDDFKAELAEFGIDYSAHISDVTAGRFGREYTRQYKGKQFNMNEHLKLGAGFDPRRTMRIHFMWDDEDKKVVIGYMGWHTKTRR